MNLVPISLGECLVTAIKINLIRIAAFLPILLLGASWIGNHALGSWAAGALLAAKIAWCMVILQPCAVLMQLSGATNDTSLNGMSAVVRIATMTFLTLIELGLGIVFFMEKAFPLSLAAMLSLPPVLAAVVYFRHYNKNRFDIIVPGTPDV